MDDFRQWPKVELLSELGERFWSSSTSLTRNCVTLPATVAYLVWLGHAETDVLTAVKAIRGFANTWRRSRSLCWSTALLFGGGMKQGFRYGRTGDDPPFPPIESPPGVSDMHAKIYRAMGIPADLAYEVEGRPFCVTSDGKGRAVVEMFAWPRFCRER